MPFVEPTFVIATCSKAIGPGARHLITIVHPRTYQRWLQHSGKASSRKKLGRPKTLETVREIIVRIVNETGWGYGRILGELRKLRIRYVGRTTIKNILKEEGLGPSPRRGPGTWDEFLKRHAETLWQVDSFRKWIWTPRGLRQCFVLAFRHVGSRRVYVAPCTFKPNAMWMQIQVQAFVEHTRTQRLSIDYVTRDRDGKFIGGFDAELKAAGVHIVVNALQAPYQNAFVERWIRSIRDECLRHFIVFGQQHFDFLTLRTSTFKTHSGRIKVSGIEMFHRQ